MHFVLGDISENVVVHPSELLVPAGGAFSFQIEPSQTNILQSGSVIYLPNKIYRYFLLFACDVYILSPNLLTIQFWIRATNAVTWCLKFLYVTRIT